MLLVYFRLYKLDGLSKFRLKMFVKKPNIYLEL